MLTAPLYHNHTGSSIVRGENVLLINNQHRFDVSDSASLCDRKWLARLFNASGRVQMRPTTRVVETREGVPLHDFGLFQLSRVGSAQRLL
jgi:hypothetical protein